MKFFYIFINSVFGFKKPCCFEGWGSWEPGPSTCGEVCSKRKREILLGADALEADDCYWISMTASCPWAEWDEICYNIDCRELFSESFKLIEFFDPLRFILK